MTNDIDMRDAIMDLSVRLAAAEEKNADYEADFRATLAEACREDDRKHCACVPHLRRRISELDAEVARLKEELQAEKKSATENIGSWQIIAGEWGAKCHHLQVEVARLKGEIDHVITDRSGWAARSQEQFDRIGAALNRVRDHRHTGEPARDDATEVEALVAEAARLKDEVAQNAQGYFKGNSVQHWMDKATAYSGIVFAVCEAFRSLGYTGEMGNLETLPARLEAFAATIRAHTGQAEREAVVAWVRGLERDYATILDKYEGAGTSEHDCCVVMLETTWKNIEGGNHWKTVGIDPERGTSAQDDTGREAQQDTNQVPWLRLMRRRWKL